MKFAAEVSHVWPVGSVSVMITFCPSVRSGVLLFHWLRSVRSVQVTRTGVVKV